MGKSNKKRPPIQRIRTRDARYHLISHAKEGIPFPAYALSHNGGHRCGLRKAVGLLKSGGYLTVDDDGGLALTEEGREIGEKIYARHEVLTTLLVKLGVSQEIAAEDACKLEHAVSDESFEAIKKLVETM